jgi:sigma-E factor negative regulatory protein RseA
MTDSNNADVSALMDGALDRDLAQRALDRVLGDPQLQQAWRRYHLIGDALREVPLCLKSDDISAGVMAAIAIEPTVLAPRPKPRVWQRRAAVAAIAASVASIAVLGLQQRVQVLAGGTAAELAEAAPATMGQTLPAALPAASVDADSLQRYFVTHSELRASQPVRPLPPHASLVGYSRTPEAAEAGSR